MTTYDFIALQRQKGFFLRGVRVFFSSGEFTPNVCMRGFSSPCAGVVGLFPPTLSNCQIDKNQFKRLDGLAEAAPDKRIYIFVWGCVGMAVGVSNAFSPSVWFLIIPPLAKFSSPARQYGTREPQVLCNAICCSGSLCACGL